MIPQVFTVGANLLLAFWSDDPTASTDTSVRDFYLTAYGVMGGLQSLFIFFAVIVITFGTINASIKLHHQLLINILRSTMAFFDTTPTGRIVNRFSKDIDEVDIMLPMHIKDIFNQVLNVCGTVFVLFFDLPTCTVVYGSEVPVLSFAMRPCAHITASTERRMRKSYNSVLQGGSSAETVGLG